MNTILPAFLSFLTTGGPVVWLLLLMSLILVSIFFVKLVQFAANGLFSGRKQRLAENMVRAWDSGDQAKSIQLVERAKDPQNVLLRNAAEHLRRNSLTGKALEDELSREASGYLTGLRSHLRSIELIASLAPLIGLLGTVLGMIEAFQAMELAGKNVDPSTLSGGIWKALLTTAVGLIVAIPATVIHNWLERRIERVSDQIQDRVGRLMTASARIDQTIAHGVQTRSATRARA